MTKLPGDRRERLRDFHGPEGEHRLPHPSAYEPRKAAWTAWERRYAAHLDRHKELIDNPEPMEGDSPAVTALLEHIETLKAIITKEKELVRALRQRATEHPETDDLWQGEELRQRLRRAGEPS